MSHSRNVTLQKIGRYFASLFGGFCLEWWAPKHNMHHMFTNSHLYDDDIKHDYKVYLYPFLYLKWRFDSYTTAIANKNIVILISNLAWHYFNHFQLHFIILLQKKYNLLYFRRIDSRILLSECFDWKPRKIKKI